MKTIRVTALDQYAKCPRSYRHMYVDGLKRRGEGNVPMALAVGGAAAAGMERALKLKENPMTDALIGATLHLQPIAPAASYDRWLEAAEAVLRSLPAWLWEIELPVMEDELAVSYGDMTLTGHPDLWYVDDVGLHVIDLKTTSQKGSRAAERAESYHEFAPQTVRYLVLLRDQYEWLRDVPMYHRHILATYNGECFPNYDKPISESALTRERAQMLDLVTRATTDTTYPQFRGLLCPYCEFAPICRAILTEGDGSYIMEEMYHKEGQDE